MSVHDLIDRIRSDPRIRVMGNGVSEEDLAAAERELGRFPGDYRAFLAAFGWIELRTETLYGLGASVDSAYRLVEGTLDLRTHEDFDWPSHFVRLFDLGDGDAWIMPLDPDDEGNYPVLFADMHLGELEYHAPGFVEWMNAILDDPELLLTSGKNAN